MVSEYSNQNIKLLEKNFYFDIKCPNKIFTKLKIIMVKKTQVWW